MSNTLTDPAQSAAGPAEAQPNGGKEAELEGLDKLQTDTAQQKNLKKTLIRIIAPLAAVLVLIGIWQVYVLISGKRADVVPGPLDVAGTFGQLWAQGTLQEAVWTSVQRGLIGFLVSAVIGTALGLLLAQVKPLRIAFGPLISGLQVLPSVAWVPAAIIWFGLSDGTVYFVLLMGAIPSIINGLISGIDQVPPQYRSMGTVLGASKLEMAFKIILPAALPGYLSGLKQGWAFSWRSLMAAEIIAIGGTLGFGLGSLLQRGRDLSDMGMVMAAILVILFVGIIVELAVFAPIERKLLRGRGLLPG
ncbi:MAG: ABC transporter permease [Renibacterium sp.]|nr:ABC transporter permease [Renibacterium sp.]